MKIKQAAHLGMCFGVRDAIALAEREAARHPVTILGDLVHNESVMADLHRQGVRVAHTLAEVSTGTVLITAHGASQGRLQEVRNRGYRLVEATCPLVHFAHARVLQLAREGYHPVIIGQRDHVEVRGLVGDLAAHDVILQEADVEMLGSYARFGVVAQTTQPVHRVDHLVDLLRRRFPNSEVRLEDTVCAPTKQRQRAAVELAAQSDVVVVVGGARSNNTVELVATCRQHCARVHHVQSPSDLRADWFHPDDQVGVTAGTSTPEEIVRAVESHLLWLAALLEPSAAASARETSLAGGHR